MQILPLLISTLCASSVPQTETLAAPLVLEQHAADLAARGREHLKAGRFEEALRLFRGDTVRLSA